MDGLAAIIYYGQKNGYKYGDIQDAVYWWVTSGKEGAPDYAGQQYQNDITAAYKRGEAKAPASYGLYMYVPDNEVTEVVQNTIGLAIWSEEDDTPGDSKTPAIANTTAKAGDKSATSDAAAQVTIANGDTLVISDDVSFENLAEGTTYTLVSELWSKGSVQQTKEQEVASASSSVTVTFDAVTPEDGQQFNVRTVLKAEGMDDVVHNDDRSMKNERVVVTVEGEKPEISNTTAKVNDTATSVELASGAEGTFTDEVTFANLEAGKEYTVVSTLQKDGADFDTKTTEKVTDTITVTFDKKITEAGKYSVKTELKDGDDVVYTHNGDYSVASETVTVTVKEPEEEPKNPTVKINKTDMAGEEVDGATIVVKAEDGTEVATWESKKGETKDISVKPGKYTLEETAAPAGYQKVTTTIEFEVAEDGTVKVTTTEVKPAGAVEYKDGVLVLKDAIEETTPAVKTKASPSEIEAAKDQKITDTVTLTGLSAGVSYTLTGELVDADGKHVADCDKPLTFTASAASETKEITFTVDGTNYAGKKLVVFETLTWAKTAVHGEKTSAEHKDLKDADQTVSVKEPKKDDGKTVTPVTTGDDETPAKDDETPAKDDETPAKDDETPSNETPSNDDTPVNPTPAPSDETRKGTLATTVEVAGNQASASAWLKLGNQDIVGVTEVTDHIAYSGLEGGATYTVTGQLVKVVDGQETVVKEVTENCVADASGSGTWVITFSDVELEQDTLYVVFETAVNQNDTTEVIEHKNVNDHAQAFAVGAGAENSGVDSYNPSDSGTETPSSDNQNNNTTNQNNGSSNGGSRVTTPATTTRTTTITPTTRTTTTPTTTTRTGTATTARTSDDMGSNVAIFALAALTAGFAAAGARRKYLDAK